MKTRIRKVALSASLIFMSLCSSAIAQTNATQVTGGIKMIAFDPPGSQFTFPVGLNIFDVVTGYYLDANFTAHGFIRRVDGAIVTFDGPSIGAGSYNGTFPTAINDFGTITGYYFDANGLQHGFVRLNDCGFDHPKSCTFIPFDAPAGVAGASPTAINLEGTITGNCGSQGFVRAPNGTLTTFDVSGASVLTTAPTGINLGGSVAGYFVYTAVSASTVKPNFGPPPGYSGFVRDHEGKITTFSPPDATNVPPGLAINLAGAITGSYGILDSASPLGQISRGFVRAPNGTFVTFDAATYPPCCISTVASSINDVGTVTGYFVDGSYTDHGFVRTSYGVITTFDAPGAGKGVVQGTVPSAINLDGAITGVSVDAANVYHGFLRISD